MKKSIRSCLFVCLYLCSSVSLFFSLTHPAQAESVTGLATVIDGDTLDIHGRRIRLHGIDAPESSQTCGNPLWRCGQRSALALDALIARRTVSCLGQEESYQRLIARCRVLGGSSDLSQAMVRAGLALAYRRYALDYVRDEDAARATRAGVWSGPFQAPWDYRSAARAPQPTVSTAAPSAPFTSCAQARNAGAAPVRRGQPGYSARLDRDGDGVACETAPTQ